MHINNLNTNNQVGLSGFTYHNTKAINSFLKSKDNNLEYKIETGSAYNDKKRVSMKDINKLKEKMIDYLKENKNNSIGLGIYRTKGNVLRFMTKSFEVYYTTEDWNEGDGHAVCVTGILDDYFIVSSWGKRLLIPISDFINNKFNVIFRNVEGIK